MKLLAVYVMLVAVAGSSCGTSAPTEPAFKPNPTLQNGDFSAGPASGWSKQSRDYVGYHSVEPIEGGGVQVSKMLCGHARLVQDVAIPNTRVKVLSRASFSAQVTRPDYDAYSALAVGYLDSEGNLLGETRYYTIAGRRGDPSSGTRHFVQLEPGEWHDIELDVANELRANLPEVVPARVSALRLALEAFGSGTSAC